MLIFFFRDKNKKKWLQIIKEFTTLFVIQKQIPLHYISNLLYRENISNYKDYLSLKENDMFFRWCHSYGKKQIALAQNKLLFEELLVRNNIPTPQILFSNSKNKFNYKDEIFNINSKKEFLSFLELIFNELKLERLFCKPNKGFQGQNIFIIDRNILANLSDSLINLVLSQEFIFQEVILQNESISKINSFSVNTLRVVTYKNQENHTEILSGFIRLGRKGAIVDNAHAGGIVVSFNIENGKIRSEGLQLIDNGGGVFFKHPDTGIVFEGYQIPYFDQVREIVVKASNLFELPLLGWDIAITPDGPIILEVNHDFHLLLSDRMENGLKNNPSFNKLYKEVIKA